MNANEMLRHYADEVKKADTLMFARLNEGEYKHYLSSDFNVELRVNRIAAAMPLTAVETLPAMSSSPVPQPPAALIAAGG